MTDQGGNGIRVYQPDPQRNTINVKEIFRQGQADPAIQAEMRSTRARDLLQEIALAGYPLIKVGRQGALTIVRAETGDGKWIEANTTDRGATICGALEQILRVLEGRRTR